MFDLINFIFWKHQAAVGTVGSKELGLVLVFGHLSPAEHQRLLYSRPNHSEERSILVVKPKPADRFFMLFCFQIFSKTIFKNI